MKKQTLQTFLQAAQDPVTGEFVAMLPANINAALKAAPLRGRPATPLWLRVPMQVLFISLALWAAFI